MSKLLSIILVLVIVVAIGLGAYVGISNTVAHNMCQSAGFDGGERNVYGEFCYNKSHYKVIEKSKVQPYGNWDLVVEEQNE